jgi:hypothetical protein
VVPHATIRERLVALEDIHDFGFFTYVSARFPDLLQLGCGFTRISILRFSTSRAYHRNGLVFEEVDWTVFLENGWADFDTIVR